MCENKYMNFFEISRITLLRFSPFRIQDITYIYYLIKIRRSLVKCRKWQRQYICINTIKTYVEIYILVLNAIKINDI